jgi:hypothetical protein
MDLTELRNEVYTLTNRPDLVAETLSAVRAATLFCHNFDYFPKDLFETGLDLGTEAYYQTLEYRTVLPRWRALKYVRKSDASGNGEGIFFNVVTLPEMIVDAYGINIPDVCYLAGAGLNFKSSTLFRYVILGAYLHPDITEVSYDSWIATEHPYAIIFRAASSVFKMTGDTSQENSMRLMALEELNNVKISQIQAVGY